MEPGTDGLSREPLSLFAYTCAERSDLYRPVMRLFLQAKERYRIQLRPDDLERALAEAPLRLVVERPLLERVLDQLVDWGNLRRSHDTARAATLEDFRRRHFVYQMTAAGEVAERAVGEVVAALEQSGSLQRVMLAAIQRSLDELAEEVESAAPRSEFLHQHLVTAGAQFRHLAENAGVFLARLEEAIDSGEVNATAFVVYKQAVIEYLEGFVSELALLGPRIANAVRRIEAAGRPASGDEAEMDWLALAARADAPPTTEGLRDVSEELRGRWRGIVAWFVGGREPAIADALRAAARGAIQRILLVLERLHEKRFRRIDRTADLTRLAGWFDRLGGRASGDREAHRLFQAAFGLFGARHLGVLHDDAERVQAGESWWAAEPVPVPPALRATGRRTALGRTASVVDHAPTRRHLAERHRRAQQARRSALARFVGRGPLALDDLPALRPEELRALLDLLGQLLAVPPDADGVRASRSRDGALRLRLTEAAADRWTVVASSEGRLTLPAWVIEVEEAVAQATRAVDGEPVDDELAWRAAG